jgi:DNA topoisomerase-2
MHAFNHEEKLRKYNTTQEIIDDYYAIRIQYYKIRKEYILEQLAKELIVLSNKARYILGNLDNTIDLRKKTREEITNLLEKMKFDKLEDDDHYKYLVKMPMDSVNKENVEKLLKERDDKERQIEELKAKTLEQLYYEELDELKDKYIKIYNKTDTKLNSHPTANLKQDPKIKKTKAKMKVVD